MKLYIKAQLLLPEEITIITDNNLNKEELENILKDIALENLDFFLSDIADTAVPKMERKIENKSIIDKKQEERERIALVKFLGIKDRYTILDESNAVGNLYRYNICMNLKEEYKEFIIDLNGYSIVSGNEDIVEAEVLSMFDDIERFEYKYKVKEIKCV